MKQFASGHDAFASFDWMDQITPMEADHRDYYFDEERRDSDFEKEEVIIPFSTPMTIDGGFLCSKGKKLTYRREEP